MPFKHIHPDHRCSGRKTYRVRNWSDYNLALEKRGQIVFVLVEDITNHWYANPEKRSPGGKEVYSDYAIEFCLQARILLKQPLRQTSGFVKGLFTGMNVDLEVPHYSELSIRAAELKIDIKRFSDG